jgi:hypothetical protein
MYKLWNLIFGRDYIYWQYGTQRDISRVFKAPDGKVYYWDYSILDVITEIKNPSDVIWLTCHPSKYFHFKEQTK